jgi:hypothetical protein
MEELKNLQQIYNMAADRFNQYDGKDFVLPNAFKEQVKEINSNTITYNKYSAIIETRGNQNGVLNIFLPNQWFYIASYFTDFYNELQKYKKEALKVVTKERLKELNGARLTDSEFGRVNRLSLDETSKNYLVRFMTDYSWWSGAKTIDRGDFYVSPILNSARLVNASQSFVADLCAFLANKRELVQAIISGEEETVDSNKHPLTIRTLQQIFYGAPGTGKSNTIKKVVDEQGKRCHRTTFHPDSDYSTFVGAYKPTMKESYITKDEVTTKEEKIIYTFCPQAFTNAYVEAWNTEEEVYLVIEEINRGNCAQIFGDLFQLLDRKNSVSEYPVEADADLQSYLSKTLAKTTRTDIPHDVKSGEKLMLPSNLYIWATMNTSDQSLFPIDSAFKRRWDWKYMKIRKGRDENGNELDWKIVVKDKDKNIVKINNEDSLSWWDFIEKINEIIASMTSSADKQLGYFFCKADEKADEADKDCAIISANTFVGKVLFYLWNDVFKDYGFEDASLFRYKETKDGKETEKDLTFPDFYDEDGENVNTTRVVDFVQKVMNWKKKNEENN